MFEYLKGKVISCEGGKLVLDVGQVGFAIKVPLSTEVNLKTQSEATVLVSTSIRDDSIRIFGFSTEEERLLFEKLQTISGVGPALALAVLSGGTPAQLREAILSENLAFFKKIKGAGPKTAKRIILELKGSIQDLPLTMSPDSQQAPLYKDALSALIALGIAEPIAKEAVEKGVTQLGPEASLDELIRKSLQEI